MRVLIINKFLYPNGGSETYIFKLGEALEQHGHEVQYFGMEHEGRCVGNRVNAYTSDMDFHGGSKLSKLTYPIKTIYSKEARVQLRKVLDDFKPDVCHLNNFNYQLTPSIILEIVKWRKETGRDCKIIFTAHDYQLVCPNHMLNNPNTHQNCEKCLGGHFVNCMKGKCIHGSTAKSAIGMMEAEFWKWKGTYKYIDTMICCSEFMKRKMDSKVKGFKSWKKNMAKKALALGVPYVTFSTATWVLKTVFSGSVNDQIGGLGDTLLLHPTNVAPNDFLKLIENSTAVLTDSFHGRGLLLSRVYFRHKQGTTDKTAWFKVFAGESW